MKELWKLADGVQRLDASWSAEGPCTVGLSGHNMNATAVGSGARTACRSWLHGGDAANPGA